MVSEPLSIIMVNLSERVGGLEEKVDTMRGEIQTIDRNIAEMLE